MQSGIIAIQNAQVVLENGIIWDGVILVEALHRYSKRCHRPRAICGK